MAILAALIAALVASAAFSRGRPDRLRAIALAGICGAATAALVAALAGDDPRVGMALGIAAAGLLSRIERDGGSPRPAVVVILALLGLRTAVALAGWLPLGPDEAQYWDWSRTPDLAYYSKPGGIAWLIHAWRSVVGDSLTGLRLLGLALASGTIALAWQAARSTSGHAVVAWSAAALAAVLPLHACTAGLLTTDVPLLLCWAAFLAVLMTTPAAGGTRAWWQGPALGVLLAIGINAKYAMLYAVPAIAIAALGLPQLRAWLRRPDPWIALAIGLAGLLPVALWNLQHDAVGLRHLAGQGGLGKDLALHPLHTLAFVGSQLAVGFPVSLLLPAAGVWAWRARAGRPAAWLLVCAAGLPLAVLLLLSLQTKVQANWAALAWIPATIVVAWWLHAEASSRSRRLALAGSVIAMLGVLLVVAAPGLRERFPTLPPSVPERKLAGWAELAEVVDRVVATQPERTLVLTAGYDVAAELAWHNRHLPRPLCANFGRRMNQYDLWPGLTDAQCGWDTVFVRELDRTDSLDGDLRSRLPPGLADDFASADQPRLVRIARGGRTWRNFLVVRLRSFDGRLDHAQTARGY